MDDNELNFYDEPDADAIWDEDMNYDDEIEGPDLGSCCACGKVGRDVRNVMMMDFRAPVPGRGWGCVVCHLPGDGAIAVICDHCLETDREIRYICDGYAGDNKRIARDGFQEIPFDHDLSKHEEFYEQVD